MYKEDLALNNLQWLICHKTIQTKSKSISIWFYLSLPIIYQLYVGYLMPNPFYTYILNIYDLVWLNFMAYQLLLVI